MQSGDPQTTLTQDDEHLLRLLMISLPPAWTEAQKLAQARLQLGCLRPHLKLTGSDEFAAKLDRDGATGDDFASGGLPK